MFNFSLSNLNYAFATVGLLSLAIGIFALFVKIEDKKK